MAASSLVCSTKLSSQRTLQGESSPKIVKLISAINLSLSENLSENGNGKEGVRFLEEEREWRLPGLLYVDDLVLCGE